MPPAGRLGDKAQVPADAHGCPGCPHPGIGPAVSGSGNVQINGRPALRVGDKGIHAACCGSNTWEAVKGASGVFINGKAAHRLGDANQHCGGQGKLVEGSADVFIGDQSRGGRAASSEAKDWIEIVLLDHRQRPVADQRYRVVTPDGQAREGTLDAGGTARVENIVSGICTIYFPDLSDDEWEDGLPRDVTT